MQEEKSNIESIGVHLKQYVETQSKIAMLTAGEKAAHAVAATVTGVTIGLAGLFFLVFLSFTLAFWLGDIFENIYVGFLIVCLVYLLIGVLLYFNKDKWLRIPVLNSMIANIFKNWDDGKDS